MLDRWGDRLSIAFACVFSLFLIVLAARELVGFDAFDAAKQQWARWSPSEPEILRPISSRVVDLSARGAGNTAADPREFSAIMLVRSGSVEDLVDMIGSLQQHWRPPKKEAVSSQKK